MPRTCVGLVIVTILSFVISGAHIAGTAFADTTNINYNVSVAPALTLTTTTNSMVLNLDPSTKTFDSKNITVGVGTNNKTGYTLTLSTPQDSTDLVRDNSEDGVSGTMPTLAAGTYTQSTFTENKWGYKITSNTSIPSTVTTDYVPFTSGNTLMESDTAKNHDEASLTFAAKIDYLQASGSYSTTLNFHLVANPQATYIQDVDHTMCTTTPMTVVDKRDNQEYVIQKLADGRCWMMTNLNLGAIDLTQDLTSDNTNCATSGSTACVATNMSGTPSLTAANFNSYEKASGTETYTAPEYIPVSGNDTTMGTPGVPYGTLYNFCAASAGTICNSSNSSNASYDLCPAGWRLPTGNTGEFQTLYSQSIYSSNANMRKPYAATNGGAAFALAGLFTNSTPTGQGTYGQYWSSTRYNGTYMYLLYLTTSNVNPETSSFRNRGFSIRCVLNDTRTLSDITYLQDMTSGIVSRTSTGTTKTLKDKRDNEEYLVGKLADGNIWLLDNLRLDPTAVSLDDLKGNTNATDQILTYFKNGGGSSPYPSSGVVAKTASGGSWSDSYNLPYVATAYKDTVASVKYGSGSGKIGVYYNLCAASAGSYCYANNSGSGNTQYDICPFGWKIPTGGSSGQYQALYTAYSSNISNFRSALSTPFSGYFSGSPVGQGSSGSFWSSTRTSNYMYTLYVDTSNVYPNNYTSGREYGHPVRCIAK